MTTFEKPKTKILIRKICHKKQNKSPYRCCGIFTVRTKDARPPHEQREKKALDFLSKVLIFIDINSYWRRRDMRSGRRANPLAVTDQPLTVDSFIISYRWEEKSCKECLWLAKENSFAEALAFDDSGLAGNHHRSASAAAPDLSQCVQFIITESIIKSHLFAWTAIWWYRIQRNCFSTANKIQQTTYNCLENTFDCQQFAIWLCIRHSVSIARMVSVSISLRLWSAYFQFHLIQFVCCILLDGNVAVIFAFRLTVMVRVSAVMDESIEWHVVHSHVVPLIKIQMDETTKMA